MNKSAEWYKNLEKELVEEHGRYYAEEFYDETAIRNELRQTEIALRAALRSVKILEFIGTRQAAALEYYASAAQDTEVAQNVLNASIPKELLR